MGAWVSYDSETIDEGSGHGGDGAGTAEITLNPGEKAHVFVERIDAAGAGENWRIAIEGSIEDTPDYAQDPPLREYRQPAAQKKRSFIVAGVYAFRVWVQNDEGTDDEVEAVVGWRKDGVSI
jgi:hypothetical protein